MTDQYSFTVKDMTTQTSVSMNTFLQGHVHDRHHVVISLLGIMFIQDIDEIEIYNNIVLLSYFV